MLVTVIFSTIWQMFSTFDIGR